MEGEEFVDLYKEAYTPWDWHAPIFERCHELGLIAFSSPFDESAVDFLEALHVPCYKIASPEIVDIPLIKKVAETGKPIIISTGGATKLEIEEALNAAKSRGCKDIILLKCTMAYPANPTDMNLRTISDMASTFGTLVGLSDHTLGIGVAIASVALGACVIEKHITLARSLGGVDSVFSMEPPEFKQLVDESKRAWQALGTARYGVLASEKSPHSHRPSLFFVEDITPGTLIEAHHIRSLRPIQASHPKSLIKYSGASSKRLSGGALPSAGMCFELFFGYGLAPASSRVAQSGVKPLQLDTSFSFRESEALSRA